jgi:hypothetical protein
MKQISKTSGISIFVVGCIASLMLVNAMIPQEGQLVSAKLLSGGSLETVFKKTSGENTTLVVPKDNAILQGTNGGRLSKNIGSCYSWDDFRFNINGKTWGFLSLGESACSKGG